MLHDVGWPHARRDDYFAPELIPEEYRQPTIEGGGLFPGISEPQPGRPALQVAGGARGGPAQRRADRGRGLRRRHGRTFDWPSFPRSSASAWCGITTPPTPRGCEQLLAPLDRHPVIGRLEANRAYHLASVHQQLMEVTAARDQLARQQAVLHRLLTSSAFALAERLSRLRKRVGIAPGSVAVSREEVERALDPNGDWPS